MPLPALDVTAVAVQVHAADWRSAVTHTGDALVASGSVQPGYAARMIEVIEDYGPYVVIAPGLALVHARPGRDVLHDGLAVVTLAEPVTFGHPHNDPVRVLLGLASTGADDHVTGVAALANLFNDPEVLPRLADAPDAQTVVDLFAAARGQTQP